MGEYFLDDQCLACNASKGYYSINPLIGQCEKSNPYYIRNHTENLLDLYPGVWRYNLYSSILEQCSNQPKNCLGGWKIGDETCLKGTIGALCQECDLYNTRGLGKYSKTAEYIDNIFKNFNYTCLLCGNQGIQLIYYKITIILLEFFFVFIWVLIQITLTVKSIVVLIIESIPSYRIKTFFIAKHKLKCMIYLCDYLKVLLLYQYLILIFQFLKILNYINKYLLKFLILPFCLIKF